MKKVVITGGAGYIGSILSKAAVTQGYDVHIVDRFYFGSKSVSNIGATLHKSDTRDLDPEIVSGAYAVLDLAAISNDPAGDLNTEITLDINFRARRRLQEICVKSGVERYVLASSCSVYGFQDEIVDETSQLNPLTTYAEANIRAEESAMSLLGQGTTFTSLRQATVFGLSPRMRFDLVVNAMALNLWKSGELKILRDGQQWRPMIHVSDTAQAFLTAISSPASAVDGQVFNVGANSHNFRVIELAEKVSSALGKELNLAWYGDPDNRSYRVDFSKIKKELNFELQKTVEDAAREIGAALEDGSLLDETRTRTLQWYQALKEWDEVLGEIHIQGRALL